MLFDFFVSNGQPRTDRHRLAGIVTVDGLPSKRLVVALNRGTLATLAATYSDPVTGAWQISNIPECPEQSIIALALDSTGNYNAEVADYLSQVAS